MSSRITFHKVIRKIHLVTSMILLAFLFFYAITGLIISNASFFQIPEVVVTNTDIPAGITFDENDPGAYSSYLEELLDVRGRTGYNKNQQGNWIFHFNFPGEDYQVTFSPDRDTLHVRQSLQKRTIFTVVRRIHGMRGFKGGWQYTAWAIFYDVTASAMVLFAITGMIIWYRIRKKYRYGWWFLSAGILIPLITVCTFYLWK